MNLTNLAEDTELSAAAFDLFASRMSERGIIIDDHTERAIRSLHRLMASLLSGESSEPNFYLSSLDPGMGKTEAVCCFLQAWKDRGFKPDGSVLIGLAQYEDILSYLERSGLSFDDLWVEVGKKNYVAEFVFSSLGRAEPSEARVLFTTQAKLGHTLSRGPFSTATAFQYRGAPRSLRIWDESLVPAQPAAMRLDSVAAFLDPIRPVSAEGAELLEGLIAAAKVAEPGETVWIPGQLSKLETLSLVVPQAQKDQWLRLVAMAGSRALIDETNIHGRQLVTSTGDLPLDLAPLVVLDASIRVRETYKVWEESGGSLVRLPAAVVDYSNLSVSHWDRGASRSTLQNLDARQEVLGAIADLINLSPPDEKWLVVHPVARGEVDVAGQLAELIDGPSDRVSCLHWGVHHGTNDYRHIRNVVIVGLWEYSGSAYAGLHLAASPGSGIRPVSKAEREAIRAGEFQHNLLQAVCRSAVRISQDGACGACDVYIVGRAGGATRSLLASTFPGASIARWRPVEEDLKGHALIVATILEDIFSDGEGGVMSKAELREAAGMKRSQDLAQVLRNPALQAWMGLNGFEATTRAILKAAGQGSLSAPRA